MTLAVSPRRRMILWRHHFRCRFYSRYCPCFCFGCYLNSWKIRCPRSNPVYSSSPLSDACYYFSSASLTPSELSYPSLTASWCHSRSLGSSSFLALFANIPLVPWNRSLFQEKSGSEVAWTSPLRHTTDSGLPAPEAVAHEHGCPVAVEDVAGRTSLVCNWGISLGDLTPSISCRCGVTEGYLGL